jgi:AMP nucleosidase
MKSDVNLFDSPKRLPFQRFTDADAAVERLELIYDTHTAFIRDRFEAVLKGKMPRRRVRASYPEVRIETSSFAKVV